MLVFNENNYYLRLEILYKLLTDINQTFSLTVPSQYYLFINNLRCNQVRYGALTMSKHDLTLIKYDYKLHGTLSHFYKVPNYLYKKNVLSGIVSF